MDNNTNITLSVNVKPPIGNFTGTGVTDIDNTDSIAIFNPNTAGIGLHKIIYIVTAAGNGCNLNETDTIEIMVSPVPDAGVGDTLYACNQSGSTIDLFTGIMGAPQTTGSWSTVSGVTPVGYLGQLSDAQIAMLGVGNHDFTYTVLGMSGCSNASTVVTLVVTDMPMPSSVDSIFPVCVGSMAPVTINGLAIGTYTVSYLIDGISQTPAMITSNGATATFNTRPLTLADSSENLTIIQIVRTDITPNCVQGMTINKKLTIYTQPILAGRDTAFCTSAPIDLMSLLTRTVVGENLEFGTTYGSYILGGSMVTPGIGVTTYYIRDSVDATGCVDTASITVSVFTNPSFTGRDTTVCAGQTIDLSTLVSGVMAGSLEYGLSYGVYNLMNPVAPTTTTTYFLRDSIEGGACVDTAMITITTTTQPELTGRDTTICAGDSIFLINLLDRVTNGTILKFGTGSTSPYDTLHAYTYLSPNSTVTYYIQDSIPATGCFDTTMLTFYVNPQPNISGRDTSICIGQTIDLSTLVVGTAINTLEYGIAGSAYSTTSSFTPNSTTTYWVRDSSAVTNCVDTAMITVNTTTQPELTGRDTSICVGDSIFLINLLDRVTSGTILKFGTGSTSPYDTLHAYTYLSPNSTVTYYIQDSIPATGCFDTTLVTFYVNPQPNISGRDTSICVGQTVDLNTLVIGSAINTLEYSEVGGSYTTSSMFMPTSTTSFIVRDSSGSTNCVDTALITINVNPLPTVALVSDDADNTIGTGNTIIFTASGGPNYEFFINNISQQGPSAVNTFTTNMLNHQDTVMVRVVNGNGCQDTASLVINVNGVPVANNDTISIVEDIPSYDIDVQINDTDPENDILTTTIITPANNGITTLLNNDSIRYMPTANFYGMDTIVYQICDLYLNCSMATVFIEVLPINDPPITQNDTIKIMEDASSVLINVLANDSDIEGDSLKMDILIANIKGVATIMMDSFINYTPKPDSNGIDVVVYEACDTGSCTPGIVIIDICPINDAPTASIDSITIPEDTLNVCIAILENDFDIDGDSIILDSVYTSSNGVVATIQNDSIKYTPPLNFTGLDSIKYIVCDSMLCDSTYIIINVLPENEAPIAVKDSIIIPEDSSNVKIAILINDIEVDGDSIIIDSVYTSINGVVATLINDTLCYTPPSNFVGIDSIKYVITDGVFKDSTYLIINVQTVNDAPIAVNDTINTFENAMNVLITVQVNDVDPDDMALVTSILTNPINGTATLVANNVDYTPNTGFNGIDSLEYKICDVAGLCDSAWVFINVSGSNVGPIAINDTIHSINEDMALLAIYPVQNDIDNNGQDDTLKIQSFTTPASGATAIMVNDTTINYVPALNFNGMDSLKYIICDTSAVCDSAWIFVWIDPVNDAPIAVDDTLNTFENAMNVLIAVQANDMDPDDAALVTTILTNPINGAATVIANNVDYTPNTGFNGIDSLEYKICDISGLCDSAWVFINVSGSNVGPIAINDTIHSIDEDMALLAIYPVQNDIDNNGQGDTLKIQAFTTPASGATVILINDTTINYVPALNFNGMDSLMYLVCDTSAVCDSAWVFVWLDPVNDPPVAVDDTLMVTMDTMNAGIDVLTNDIDIDDITLSIDTVFNSTNGMATLNATKDSVFYTPNSGYSGLDTIAYIACDTSNTCDTALVFITVGFVNTPPIAVNDTVMSVAEDAAIVSIDPLANDIEINGLGDSLTITAVTMPASGATAVIINDTIINYFPAMNFNGADSMRYVVCDTSMACDSAWVFIFVNPANDAPIAVNDTVNLNKDTMNALFAVKLNDIDIDGDNLSVSLLGASTQGVTATVVNDSIQYSAPSGFVGTDTLTYQISDGALTDNGLIFIVITAPNNNAPIANTDFATTNPTVTINIDVQDNDMDSDGDDITTTVLSGPAAGNSVIVLNGDSLQYTPAISFVGQDTIVYQICDPSAACDADTVFITVENTVQVSINVFLQGPYDPVQSLMHDSLRRHNLIPLTEPYSTLPSVLGAYQFVHKNGGGGETIANPGTILADNAGNSIVDWVYLELLRGNDTIPVASRAALIQRDGDVVDIDGVSPVSFDFLPDGNYFLSIRHRNHLGVMTNAAFALVSGATPTINFSQIGVGGTPAYGTNPMKIIGSTMVLWAGDGNADRRIIYDGMDNDRDPVFFEVLSDPLNVGSNYNYISKGYKRGDYDMKGSAIYTGGSNDSDIIFFNVLLHPDNTTSSPLFIITEQIRN